MTLRGAGLCVLLLAAFAYASGFVLAHVVSDDDVVRETDGWALLLDVQLFAPLVGAVVAGHLWPRWWLPVLTAAVLMLVPIGVDTLERELRWYPAGVSAETYERSGMDYLTTSILAIIALPAGVTAALGVGIAKTVARIRTAQPSGAIG